MQIASGRVRHKTVPTFLDLRRLFFLKLTLMGTPQNRTIGVNLAIFVGVLAQKI